MYCLRPLSAQLNRKLAPKQQINRERKDLAVALLSESSDIRWSGRQDCLHTATPFLGTDGMLIIFSLHLPNSFVSRFGTKELTPSERSRQAGSVSPRSRGCPDRTVTSAALLSCRKRTESPTLKRAGRWVCVRVRKSWGGLITWRSCPLPTIKPQKVTPKH